VDAAAAVRFVSFEPLLEDLGRMELAGVHWAIAGGESGPLVKHAILTKYLRAYLQALSRTVKAVSCASLKEAIARSQSVRELAEPAKTRPTRSGNVTLADRFQIRLR